MPCGRALLPNHPEPGPHSQWSSKIVQRGRRVPKARLLTDLDDTVASNPRNLLILLILQVWLTSLDNFRNWLRLGLQPAKSDEGQ